MGAFHSVLFIDTLWQNDVAVVKKGSREQIILCVWVCMCVYVCEYVCMYIDVCIVFVYVTVVGWTRWKTTLLEEI